MQNYRAIKRKKQRHEETGDFSVRAGRNINTAFCRAVLFQSKQK